MRETIKNTSYEFLGLGEINIDNDNQATGKITWSIVKVDPSGLKLYKDKMNATAVEYVKGEYSPEKKELTFTGINKDDFNNIISLDQYIIDLFNDSEIRGKTKGSGVWDGMISGSYKSKTILEQVSQTQSITRLSTSNAIAPGGAYTKEYPVLESFYQRTDDDFGPQDVKTRTLTIKFKYRTDQYVGETRAHKAYGRGKLYSNGVLIREGQWITGNYIGPVPENYDKNKLTDQAYLNYLMEIFVMQECHASRNFGNYLHGSFKNVLVTSKSADGYPLAVKADFSFINDDDVEKTAWLEVLFANRLPYIIHDSVWPYLYYGINRINIDAFSDEDNIKISKAYTKFILKNRNESPSYIAAIKKQSTYNTNVDNLINCYLEDNGTHWVYTKRKIGGYYSNGQLLPEQSVTDGKELRNTNFIKGYKNISNSPVYIKGMRAVMDNEGKITYEDASLRIDPLAVTKAVTIYKELFPDHSSGIEYWGDEIKGGEKFDSDNLVKIAESKNNSLEIDFNTEATNIKLNRGDKITLTPSGKVIVGIENYLVGPEGFFGKFAFYMNYGKSDALLARIGKGEWVAVDKKTLLVATQPGTLQIVINDGSPYDNKGAFHIDYKIIKAH